MDLRGFAKVGLQMFEPRVGAERRASRRLALRKCIAIWVSACMVTGLVPVSPAMAQEPAGQEGIEVVSDGGETTAPQVEEERPSEEDRGSEGEQPSEEEQDVERIDLAAQAGDLAYGEVQGTDYYESDYIDGEWVSIEGYFTDGVTGATDAGETPKVYYAIDYDSPEHDVTLVKAGQGITAIDIPTAIRVGDETLKVKRIHTGAFAYSSATLSSVSFYDNSELEVVAGFGSSQLESISLPASVSSIGENAFAECSSLANVALPDDLQSIGENAFADCGSLADVALPEGLQSVGDGAFASCPLTSVIIPPNVTALGNGAFQWCKELESVTYAEGSRLASLGDECFIRCEKLGIDAVNDLPTTVTSIGKQCFLRCEGMEGDLVLQDDIESIGAEAFRDCYGLTGVKLPAGLATCGASAFFGCHDLMTLTWPTNPAFDTISYQMFAACSLRDPAIITSIPATVATIGTGAFSSCEFETVDIPDTVDKVGYAAFDCQTLRSLEWPQDNGNFDTFYGGISGAGPEVANAILASLPPSVKTIANEDDRFGIYGEGLTEIDLSATKVETIENRCFYRCENVKSITLPSTLKSIGDEAFARMFNPAWGIEIVIPASVTHIGRGAFDDCGWDNRDLASRYFMPMSLHIMNPDYTFESRQGSSYAVQTAQIDGEYYYVPFWYGQTIYASATDSQGNESFIHKWAQSETIYRDDNGSTHTCKVEDLGKYVKSRDGVPAFTFEWVEITAPVTVGGTVPAGATLTMTQGSGASRTVTDVPVAADGSFSTEASGGTGTVLRVSLPGYYDYTLTRSASAMRGGWTDIAVTQDQMERMPAQGYMALKLKRLVATGDDGSPSYDNIAGDDAFDYTLVDRQGHSVAFSTQGAILTITANNDDDPTNDIGPDVPLTITATPTQATAQTYQIGAVTATATLRDGAFDAVLPAWGMAAITVDSADTSLDGSIRIMVFKGNRLVDEGNAMPGLTYTTDRLEAGTYTVVAVDSTAGFSTSSLTSLSRMGLDDFVARQEVIVSDGAQTEVSLTAPAFDVEQLMANAGLTRAALTLKSRNLVFGGEQTAMVDYELDPAKATSAEFRIVLPANTAINSCGSSETGGRVDYEKVASDDGGDTYAVRLNNATTGKLYVKFTATTAGDCTVGLSAIVNRVMVPIKSATYKCAPLTMALSQDVLSSHRGSVTIYASPLEPVTLSVTSGLGTSFSTQTVRTGSSCSKTVNYNLPGTALPGESFYVRASIGTKGTSGYQMVFKQVTYIPGVTVENLTVTNGDNSFALVSDYEVQDGGVTVLYHKRDKKYARWGFSMTLDASMNQTLDDAFNLDVETLGGALMEIPMRRSGMAIKDDGTPLVTYTGTYLDDVWLEAYDWAVENGEGQVWNFDWDKVFVPKVISFPNSLLTSIVTVDPEILEEVAQRDYEERMAAQQQMVQHFIAEYRESFDEGGDVRETIDAYDAIMHGVVDILNDAIRHAAAEAGETVGEGELIPAHTDTIGYFTEAGVDGVTVDDLLFDDEWGDPLCDPIADGDDEDWYTGLFGTDEFEDENGVTHRLSDDEKEALSEAKTEIDRVVYAAEEAERTLCKGLGLSKSDLTSYKSWTGVEADALKGSGVDVTDLKTEGSQGKPMPTNEMGTTGTYVEQKSDTSGFVASDGTQAHADVTFSEATASAFEGLINFMSSDAYGVGTMVFDEFKGIYLDRASTLGPALHHYPAVRRFVTRSLRAVDRNIARGVSVRKAANFVNTYGGNILGIKAVYDGWTDYVDAKALWESTKDDTNQIDTLIEFWRKKDCPERYDCIMALLDEKAACEALCRLLQKEYQHLAADATVTTVTTSVSVAGSVTTLGTAGTAVSVAGTVYNSGSSILHSTRDIAIKEANGKYKYMTDQRKKKCKSCCPYGDPTCKPCTPGDPNCTPGGGGVPEGGTTTYTPENYLDPSGIVYEAVLSNPVEGATVTVWRSTSPDGADKVADESFVATGQMNPQVTAADGIFQWDVTSGWYQVVVDDNSVYTGASSAWMPVVPPQLGVNLGVVSTMAPAVASVSAYTDCVELVFSQWMQTGDVSVTGIDGATCTWVDCEESGDPNDGDVVYSKVLRITRPDGFEESSTVSFGLAADGVTSYNGKNLVGDYDSGALTVSRRPAQVLLNIEGDDEGKATGFTEQVGATDDIDAYVVDADGKPLAGQKVSVTCGSLATLASLADGGSSAVTDEGGKASFNLSAHMPGMTEVTFSVEGSTLTRTVDLVVEGEQVRPNRPQAIIINGDDDVTTIDADAAKNVTVKVKPGAFLILKADEGDDIYFTLDDTCPCQEGSRYKYEGSLVLFKSTYYRIAAYNPAFDPSEGGYSAYSRRLNLTIEVEDTAPFFIDADPADDANHGAEVDWMGRAGISTGWEVTGGREFRGMLDVKRCDFAAFLYRMGDLSDDGERNDSIALTDAEVASTLAKVSDCSPQKTSHAMEVAWMIRSGISTGWPDKGKKTVSFKPMANVARQDMAAFLYRFADLRDNGTQDRSLEMGAAQVSFRDVRHGDEANHASEVEWLASVGVTKGWGPYGGKYEFRGTRTVARQDMAAFMYRLNSYLEG